MNHRNRSGPCAGMLKVGISDLIDLGIKGFFIGFVIDCEASWYEFIEAFNFKNNFL